MLKDIAMLAISNNRSRYYLQKLLDHCYQPSFVLVLQDADDLLPGQREEDVKDDLIQLLIVNRISHQVVLTANVNAKEVIDVISQRSEKYFIFSAYGGAILKKEILMLGKKFIHVHPGKLPDFKGSTTLYYQILSGHPCYASAIFLDEAIDSGAIIDISQFLAPAVNEDLDYEYDPRIRAELLCRVIDGYVKTGQFKVTPQHDSGETYYVIHPLLRHIVKLKIGY